mmetsp:Transcript_6604/g.12195  ORF Transcript_6604/g.12195 Transcript_6604/m.12195 type:complete len:99 (+) Transcript_6604:64-360(+)
MRKIHFWATLKTVMISRESAMIGAHASFACCLPILTVQEATMEESFIPIILSVCPELQFVQCKLLVLELPLYRPRHLLFPRVLPPVLQYGLLRMDGVL